MKKEKILSLVHLVKESVGPKRVPNLDVYRSELDLASRNWGGNQKRKPGSYGNKKDKPKIKAMTMEEKIKLVKDVKRRGRTATGQNPDAIDDTPVKPELTTYY